jgi:hypothetical protein
VTLAFVKILTPFFIFSLGSFIWFDHWMLSKTMNNLEHTQLLTFYFCLLVFLPISDAICCQSLPQFLNTTKFHPNPECRIVNVNLHIKGLILIFNNSLSPSPISRSPSSRASLHLHFPRTTPSEIIITLLNNEITINIIIRLCNWLNIHHVMILHI